MATAVPALPGSSKLPGSAPAQAASTTIVLAELDQEAQLLRLLASEARHGPRILTDAVTQVVDLTYREFAEWITDRSGSLVSAPQADAIATIGLGALIAARLLPNVLGTAPSKVDDNAIVEIWVSALEHLLTTAKPNVSA
jgi:hypothetical protein